MPFPKLNSLIAGIGRLIDEKQAGFFQGNLLRVTCFSGLILSLLTGAGIAVVYFLGGGPAGQSAGQDRGFYRLLREYDLSAQVPGAETADLDRLLDRMEKKTEGVESWFSVLKRRRHLARLNSRFIPAYRQSARRARRAYPYSEPLAALAAAALIQNTAINGEAETELRDCLPLLSGGRFGPLRLSLHVLLGDLKNPETAAARLPADLTAAGESSPLPISEREVLSTDLAIVKLLRGDSAAAAAEMQSVFAQHSAGQDNFSAESLRFSAEFLYDFGDILRSAELFSLLPDDAALLRQADALWLAGYAVNARAVWSILPLPRALYNLAVSAEDPDEAVLLLERLGGLSGGDISRQYGLIRYSRFLDTSQAVAVLEAGAKEPGGADGGVRALVDLEILKRRTELWGTGRLTAETWLLLGRYPAEENLYQWGAWFFDFQRQYGESAVLLKNAARRGFSGRWFSLHEALQMIRDGNLDAAETSLVSLSAQTSDWPAAANLGRVLEARRAPARALEYYEIAASAVSNREAASLIQFRAAHCLKTLGRAGDSRRVLEYALDLNPDNLGARLELGRLPLYGQP
jgi:tetratricopeptide (TPR) repeat protein